MKQKLWKNYLKKKGYQIVESDEVADIYVINTCTVTNLGDRKSRQFIRRAKRSNKNSIIAVVGCYSQVAPDEVGKIEGVDVVIGTTHRDKIVDLCEKAITNNEKINIVKDIKGYKDFENLDIINVKSKTRAYIKIQEGCNQFCSYCIIPYARGPIRSRNLKDIIEETKRLSEAGFKEIILTGDTCGFLWEGFRASYFTRCNRRSGKSRWYRKNTFKFYRTNFNR